MDWVFIETFVDIIVSVLLALLTASIAYFAYRQHRLERTKLKLEAYDRRLRIRDAIQIFISDIEIEGTTDDEHLIAMLRETKHARFLFNKRDGITSSIDSLYQKGLELEYKQKRVESERRPLSKEREEEMWKEILELKGWFTKQHTVIDSMFEKYLQL